MDRLESCYFCGATNASLDEYPVVPESLSPSPDEQAAVTLCPDCREKLATVVKRIASAAEPPDEAAAPVSGRAPGDSAIESSAEPADPDPAPTGTGQSDDESVEQHDDGAASAIDAAESPSTDADPTSSADNELEGDKVPDDEPEPQRPETLSPFQYNKVMRLLENREFPVEVAEFEAIATSAYELQPSDVDAVIEAAIDRGLIERGEDGETLHRRG